MTHPTAQVLADTIYALRKTTLSGEIKNDAPVADEIPTVYFSWDENAAGTALSLSEAPGCLLQITQEVKGTPEWLVLNLALGPSSFEAGDVLGIVADIEGFEGHDLPLFVRTARGDGFVDTALQDIVVGSATPAVRTVLHTVNAADPMTWGEGFHTLVLNLPQASGTLTIRDFSFMVLPAERGLRSTPETLSSIA